MKKILIYSLILFALGTNLSHAATTQGNEYKLLEPLPCVEGTGNDCKAGQPLTKINLDTYIQYVFKFSIALAVFLAIIMIIWGGFEYMTSEVPFIKGNAKTRITNAVVGLLCALVSYLVLLTIDPRLVQINSTIDPVCPPGKVVKDSICESIDAFKSKLAEDIRSLGVVDQQKVSALEKKIDDLVLEEKDLDYRYAEIIDPNDPDYISKEDYEKEKVKISQSIKAQKIEQARIAIRGVSAKALSDSLSILQDSASYSNFGKSSDDVNDIFTANTRANLNNINSELDEQLKKYADQLKQSGDLQGAQYAEKIDTYIKDNLTQEEKISTAIKRSGQKVTESDKVFLVATMKNSFDTLKKYQKGTTLGDNDPFAEIYRGIANSRISRINPVVNCPTCDTSNIEYQDIIK